MIATTSNDVTCALWLFCARSMELNDALFYAREYERGASGQGRKGNSSLVDWHPANLSSRALARRRPGSIGLPDIRLPTIVAETC